MRLIDADAMMQKVSRLIDYCHHKKMPKELGVLFEIADTLMDCPTIEADPVKRGRWEERDRSGIAIHGFMVCSRCGVMIPVASVSRYCLSRLNFCPNCGAKMTEDEA